MKVHVWPPGVSESNVKNEMRLTHAEFYAGVCATIVR